MTCAFSSKLPIVNACPMPYPESAIWQIVRHYAAQVGHSNFAPHDARRSCARIYYDAQAPLKQIQSLLGHDKLDTTARYVNDEQKFGGEAVSKVADISLRHERRLPQWHIRAQTIQSLIPQPYTVPTESVRRLAESITRRASHKAV